MRLATTNGSPGCAEREGCVGGEPEEKPQAATPRSPNSSRSPKRQWWRTCLGSTTSSDSPTDMTTTAACRAPNRAAPQCGRRTLCVRENACWRARSAFPRPRWRCSQVPSPPRVRTTARDPGLDSSFRAAAPRSARCSRRGGSPCKGRDRSVPPSSSTIPRDVRSAPAMSRATPRDAPRLPHRRARPPAHDCAARA